MRYFTLIITFLLLAQLAMGQTYIKNVGLIEGVTSTATAAGTTTLTVNSQTNQMFTGVANQTVVLPDATTLPIGRRFYITNRSTGIVTVNTNGGAGLTTIAPDTQKTFIVKTVGTAAGTWDVTNWNVSSVSGILPIANGGTNKALTLSAGGIPYFDADSFEVLSAGSSGQILRSGGASAPSWSTATFPATAGTSGTLLQSNGTNWVNTTATFPGTATGTGTLLRADGTNWAATTVTFPNTTTINQILYSSANNVVTGLATGNTSALVTSSTGVPSLTLGTTANRLLRTDGTTVSFAQAALTTDVTGVLPLANGGTNKNMTAVNGGVVWTDTDSQEVSAAGTSGQLLQSGGAAVPVWVGGVSAKTGNYTLVVGDDVVTGDTSGGTFTLTLPTAVGIAGKVFTIKKVGTGTTALAIATTSSQTIDGVTSLNLTNANDFITVKSNNANWIIVGKYIAPTVQRLTSGTGATYTTPNLTKYIIVEIVGAGGGGGGSRQGATGNGGTGGAGGTTSFGSSLLTCTGGAGGAEVTVGAGGAGGTTTLNSPAVILASVDGSNGNFGNYDNVGTTLSGSGSGGVSPFGGAGASAGSATSFSAKANSGSGGGGAGTAQVSIQAMGGGGGAGGYGKVLINSPSSTYTYTIGAGGPAGTTGTGGSAGGVGGSGVVVVTEFYQ